MRGLFNALNMLGEVPYRVNVPVLGILEQVCPPCLHACPATAAQTTSLAAQCLPAAVQSEGPH